MPILHGKSFLKNSIQMTKCFVKFWNFNKESKRLVIVHGNQTRLIKLKIVFTNISQTCISLPTSIMTSRHQKVNQLVVLLTWNT